MDASIVAAVTARPRRSTGWSRCSSCVTSASRRTDCACSPRAGGCGGSPRGCTGITGVADDDRPTFHAGTVDASVQRPGEPQGGARLPRVRRYLPRCRRVHRQPPAPSLRWPPGALDAVLPPIDRVMIGGYRVHLGDTPRSSIWRGRGSRRPPRGGRRSRGVRVRRRRAGRDRQRARPSCAAQAGGVPRTLDSLLPDSGGHTHLERTFPGGDAGCRPASTDPRRSCTGTARGRSPRGGLPCSSRSASSWRSPAGKVTPPTRNGRGTPSSARPELQDAGRRVYEYPYRAVRRGSPTRVARTIRERLLAAGWSPLSSPAMRRTRPTNPVTKAVQTPGRRSWSPPVAVETDEAEGRGRWRASSARVVVAHDVDGSRWRRRGCR